MSSFPVDLSSGAVFKGSAVSLTSSGLVRSGGGTSIYRNTVDLGQPCPKYLNIDAIFDSNFIVSYADGSSKGQSSFQLVSMTAANAGEVVYSLQHEGDVHEVVTLSQAGGLFVAVEQDFSDEADQAFVFAGLVQADGTAFTLGDRVLYSDDVYSVNPVITRLSENSFAMSYYDTSDSGEPIMSTRVGTVDDLKITLTPSVQYAMNTNYSVVHDVVGIGSSKYIISYYYAGLLTNRTADPSAKVNPGGPLLTQLAQYDANDNTVALINEPVEYLSSSPAYYLSSATIDDVTAVLVFADRSLNYGILSVLVSIDSVYGVLEFGSSLALSSGQALGAGSSAVMDLDVVAVPPAADSSCRGTSKPCSRNSFTVLYSDATNSGEVTVISAKVCLKLICTASSYVINMINPQVTAGFELVQSSAEFVIDYVRDPPQSEDSYAWGGLAALSNSQVGIISAATDAACSVASVSQLNMMEMLPKPFGMVMDRSDNKAVVLVSGTVDFENILPGVTYYTNTIGTVMSGNMFYGEICTASEAVTYIDLQEDYNVILSLDSVVGTGVSNKKILLAPKY